jgi:hypothetical protein
MSTSTPDPLAALQRAVAFYKVSENVPETHKELTSSKLLI